MLDAKVFMHLCAANLTEKASILRSPCSFSRMPYMSVAYN